jgi:hypothetical protein
MRRMGINRTSMRASATTHERIMNPRISSIIAVVLTVLPASGHEFHFDQPGRSGVGPGDGFASFAFEAGWASRYISEGRETFGNSGIFSALAGVSFNPLAFELWHGASDSSADREFEASLFYSIPDLPVEAVLGLTYLTDLRGGDKDWDLSLGLSDELLLGIQWHADFTYAVNERGGYLEAGLTRDFQLGDFLIMGGSHLGANLGYVPDGHDGFDHWALQLEISRHIRQNLSVSYAVSYYMPIRENAGKHPADADLFDGLQFGIAAAFNF